MRKLMPLSAHKTLSAAIVFCIGLVLLTLIGGSAVLIERMRQTALHAIETALQNAALVVKNVVNRQLLQIDGALASLPGLFTAAPGETPGVDEETARRLLRGLNFQTFVFRDIIIVRPNGTIWASARPNPWNGNFPVKLFANGAPGGA